jgi:hypothetical protein
MASTSRRQESYAHTHVACEISSPVRILWLDYDSIHAFLSSIVTSEIISSKYFLRSILLVADLIQSCTKSAPSNIDQKE